MELHVVWFCSVGFGSDKHSVIVFCYGNGGFYSVSLCLEKSIRCDRDAATVKRFVWYTVSVCCVLTLSS